MLVNGAELVAGFPGGAVSWTWDGKLVYVSLAADVETGAFTIAAPAAGGGASGSSSLSAGATVASPGSKGGRGASALTDGALVVSLGKKGSSSASALTDGATVATPGRKGTSRTSALTDGATVGTSGRKGGVGASSVTDGALVALLGRKGGVGASSLLDGASVETAGSAGAPSASGSSSLSAGASVGTTGEATLPGSTSFGLTPKSRRRGKGVSTGGLTQRPEPRRPDVATGPAETEWRGLRGRLVIAPVREVAPAEPWMPDAALPAFAAPKPEPPVVPEPSLMPVLPMPVIPFEVHGDVGETAFLGLDGALELTLRAGATPPDLEVAGVGGELWLQPGAHRDEEDLPPQVLEMLFA